MHLFKKSVSAMPQLRTSPSCRTMFADRLWGAQTQKSLQNFELGRARDCMPDLVVQAFGISKKSAAKVFSRFMHLEGSSFSKMMQTALACGSSSFTSLASDSVRDLQRDHHPHMGAAQHSTLLAGMRYSLQRGVHETARTYCTVSNDESQDNQATPQQEQPSVSTYNQEVDDCYAMFPSVRRRPYNIEAKLRMKQYRREAEMQMRQKELEEEQKNFQLDYSSIYQKGAPGTVQGVIKEIIHLGYFVSLPNGREGLLSASHLGCSGGLPLLERLFKVGQEIAVRVIEVHNPGGKDRVYVRP